MASNRGVAYMKPGEVEIQSIDYPKLALGSRKCEHGVILKIVSTNICGSDQHMVRGRTTAPQGIILGHEITGEVIEAGLEEMFVLRVVTELSQAHGILTFMTANNTKVMRIQPPLTLTAEQALHFVDCFGQVCAALSTGIEALATAGAEASGTS